MLPIAGVYEHELDAYMDGAAAALTLLVAVVMVVSKGDREHWLALPLHYLLGSPSSSPSRSTATSDPVG
jgi:hypothetical protein